MTMPNVTCHKITPLSCVQGGCGLSATISSRGETKCAKQRSRGVLCTLPSQNIFYSICLFFGSLLRVVDKLMHAQTNLHCFAFASELRHLSRSNQWLSILGSSATGDFSSCHFLFPPLVVSFSCLPAASMAFCNPMRGRDHWDQPGRAAGKSII